MRLTNRERVLIIVALQVSLERKKKYAEIPEAVLESPEVFDDIQTLERLIKRYES